MLPSGSNLVTAVLRTGRRRRVLRGAAGSLAIVAATLVASGILLHTAEPTPVPGQLGFAYPETVPPHQPPLTTAIHAVPDTVHVVPELVDHQWLRFSAPVGVVAYDQRDALLLATGDGVVVGLAHLREVISAQPLGSGWALEVGGHRPTLWWAHEQQRPILVLGSLDALTVDHSQVAWRRGPVLSAGQLSDSGELEHQVDAAVPDGDVDPVGFVGDAVLLRHTGPDGTRSGFGTWRPESGAYEPEPSADVAWVFGTRPGGETAVGLVTVAGQLCLALLDGGAGLAVEATACLPVVPGAGPAALSPDGRWLLGTSDGAIGADEAGGSEAILVDLDAAFAGDLSAGFGVDGVAGPLSQPVWPDARSVVFVAEDGVVQLMPDRAAAGAAGAAEVVPVPGEPVAVFPLV